MSDVRISIVALAELAPPQEVAERLGLRDGALRLRRAWPRAADHLLLEYGTAGGLAVPGQWFADSRRAEAAVGGLPERLAALLPPPAPAGGAVVIQLGGADCRLRGLARLVTLPGARLVVHQPERRAVVRLAGERTATYAKLAPSGRAAAMAAAGVAAAELGGGAFETPRLLAVRGSAGAAFWSALPGIPLHELPGGAGLERAAHAMGAALRALHDSPAPQLAARHGPTEEIATIDMWLARVLAFDPAAAARIAGYAPGVRAGLAAARGPQTTIHRDYYDKQVLLADDGRIGMLDFDTLAVGEPALDLANAVVHMELRAHQGTIGAGQARQAAAALVEGYRPGPAVRARMPAYAAAARLRLACVYTFRPPWRGCVDALLTDV